MRGVVSERLWRALIRPHACKRQSHTKMMNKDSRLALLLSDGGVCARVRSAECGNAWHAAASHGSTGGEGLKHSRSDAA